ncbi:DUF4281 domain-containing protein [Pelagibacterales bacterium SAG-MED29]|nr:DUF4281 domain-containing protein [Pelagibacterales bacterium SAG-MED29]
MINNLLDILSYENIYLIANWGVIPFWLLLIISPNHGITNFFVQSIIAPLLLASAYGFVAYDIFLEGNILDSFELYRGLEDLYSMFSSESFLLIFWLHFLAISLFLGAWISRDSQRYMVPRFFVVISLVLTYFTGPVGLLIYWFVRIFFAKKINFND